MRKIVMVLLAIATLSLNSFTVFAENSTDGLKIEDINTINSKEQIQSEIIKEDADISYDADILATDSMSTDSMSTDSMSTDSLSTMENLATSNYGLIPNDINQKNNNAKLLNRALNMYGSISLNGKFYIGNTSEAVTNSNIEIIGLNDSELIFDGRSTALFDANKINNLTISNIKFTNLRDGSPLLIAYGKGVNTSKINRVKIEGCTFQGNISVYRMQGDGSLNPDVVDFGINEFIFTNNYVFDTEVRFIVLNDIPYNNIEISNNIINNFQIVFAHLGLTNGNTYGEQLAKSGKFIGIYNNKVTCDDGWWAKEGSSSYYTFILTENAEVVYDSNHVEGLKADFDVALYDAYLSSSIVTYTNNTWINNICFNENKKNNVLLKSKGGYGSLMRLYSDNTFIVEESFAERVGRSKSELFVYFMDLSYYSEEYVIKNNIFDVYDLRFPVASREIKKYVFENNDLRAKYALGGLAMIRLTDTYQPTIEITNNNIQIEQTGKHPSGQTNGFQLVRMVDARTNTANGLAKSISIEDNTIQGPFNYVIFRALSDVFKVTNNKFNVASTQFKSFGFGSNNPELGSVIVAKY